MSSTGLISGVPILPEQAQFCIGLVFPGFYEENAVSTMTVGTGNATLDASLIPEGTQVAIEVAPLNASAQVGPVLESVCSGLPGASAAPIRWTPFSSCRLMNASTLRLSPCSTVHYDRDPRIALVAVWLVIVLPALFTP